MTNIETEGQVIQKFTNAMIAKMIERRSRYKPFGWRDPQYKTIEDLTEHLYSEINEWQDAENTEDEMSELVDIANTAFMLYDRLEQQTKL